MKFDWLNLQLVKKFHIYILYWSTFFHLFWKALCIYFLSFLFFLLTFLRHVAWMFTTADVTVGDMQWTQTHQLVFISCSSYKKIGCFNFLKMLKYGMHFSLYENRYKQLKACHLALQNVQYFSQNVKVWNALLSLWK